MAGKKFKKALDGYDPLKKLHGRRGLRDHPASSRSRRSGTRRSTRRSASASTRSTPTRWSAARS